MCFSFLSVNVEPCYIYDRTYQFTPNVCSVLYSLNLHACLCSASSFVAKIVSSVIPYPILYRWFPAWGNTSYEIINNLAPSGKIVILRIISLCDMNIKWQYTSSVLQIRKFDSCAAQRRIPWSYPKVLKVYQKSFMGAQLSQVSPITCHEFN